MAAQDMTGKRQKVKTCFKQLLSMDVDDTNLVDALKDGKLLCMLANRTGQAGIKVKTGISDSADKENVHSFVKYVRKHKQLSKVISLTEKDLQKADKAKEPILLSAVLTICEGHVDYTAPQPQQNIQPGRASDDRIRLSPKTSSDLGLLRQASLEADPSTFQFPPRKLSQHSSLIDAITPKPGTRGGGVAEGSTVQHAQVVVTPPTSPRAEEGDEKGPQVDTQPPAPAAMVPLTPPPEPTGAKPDDPPATEGSTDKVCTACKQSIKGTRLETMGQLYHPQCLCCSSCKECLVGPFYLRDGARLCSACHDVSTGQSSSSSGASNTCGGCGKEIGVGSRLLFGTIPYHPQCFVCSECGREIAAGEKFMENKGPAGTNQKPEPICVDCDGDRICAVCRKYIASDSDVLKAGTNRYHPDCMRCTVCSQSLVGQPFVCDKGKLLCADDYRRAGGMLADKGSISVCHGCQQPLTGSITQALGKSWHGCCFKCCGCNNPVEGSFYPSKEDDSQPMCQDCYVAKVAIKCSACTQPILGEEYVIFSEANYHRRCLVCTHCSCAITAGLPVLAGGKIYCQAHTP